MHLPAGEGGGPSSTWDCASQPIGLQAPGACKLHDLCPQVQRRWVEATSTRKRDSGISAKSSENCGGTAMSLRVWN